ncbi:hypothetical protein CSIM01_07207 [Colletotrichum simmondsii]|uniref:Uncharacterized protein n=1 Tax=Colletotrichum simmondsii TaxID=703756 RepID=A0A135RPW8_9PEZI|nr:hypothetical protein CSIM01_07207 [Colletotrichum simmondsii]
MESVSNIVNKSALETATTTAAITSLSAPASTMNLQQRIAKRRRDWTLTLTDGPVSSPGPKAKYRRSRSWSTRVGVDAPLNAERQVPVLYAIAISKSKSNIPSSPTSSSSSSSAIEGVINDEYPEDAEEYRICPDTDSPRYKHESDVGLWSGPLSSPGPMVREVVGIDSSSESGDSVDDRFAIYNSEYEDDSEDFDLAMGYYSDSDSSSDGGDYPDPDIALADDNNATTVITWSFDGTTLLRDSPNGSGRYSPPVLSDRPEPDLVTEYTLSRWVNGVSERMIYVDFDYSDTEYDEELPVVELRLPEDEKDRCE